MENKLWGIYYLVVEIDEQESRNETNGEQPCPVRIINDVLRVVSDGGLLDDAGPDCGLVVGGVRGDGSVQVLELLVNVGLEKLGDVDADREQDDWDDVFEKPLLASLRTVDGLAVVDRVVDCDVPFQCDPHRHEHWSRDCDGEEGIEEVGEQIDVDFSVKGETLPERLEDAANQNARIHAYQSNQEKVEWVPHVISERQSRQDQIRANIADSNDACEMTSIRRLQIYKIYLPYLQGYSYE